MSRQSRTQQESIADLRLTLEGLVDLTEDLLEGLLSERLDIFDSIGRLSAINATARSCLEASTTLGDESSD